MFDASTPKCKHCGSVTQRVFQFDPFDFSKGKITLYPVLCSSALQLIYFVSWMKATLIINHFYWLQRLPLSRRWSWIYNPIKFIHFSACWGALRYIIPWVRFDFLSRLCGLFVKCPKLKKCWFIYSFIFLKRLYGWRSLTSLKTKLCSPLMCPCRVRSIRCSQTQEASTLSQCCQEVDTTKTTVWRH